MNRSMHIGLISIALAGSAFIISTFEKPVLRTVQTGYRGTGMEQVYNPRLIAAAAPLNVVPAGLPRLPDAGPRAGTTYQNVQVLGDVSVGNFTRLMVAMTQWVSPTEGCNYCHAGNNFASDDLYTKVVARRMLQMTQTINAEWKPHVQEVGVTCYTCHRGQPVPANSWTTTDGERRAHGLLADSAGQNQPGLAVGTTSLPTEPFSSYLMRDTAIRVVGDQALPGRNFQSIKQTEETYALMMHFSQALGVNCTFCHNSRSFTDWQQSSPQRTTAWYGIRMVRDINNSFIAPLGPQWAAHPNGLGNLGPRTARLGPQGDPLKVNCTTCHQGAYQPLYGAPMAAQYPELLRVSGAAPPR